jgi:hypothetical protein
MMRLVRDKINWHGASVTGRIEGIQTASEVGGYPLTWAQAKEQYNRLLADEIWVNDEYQVNLSRMPAQGGVPALVHLSIKRLDKRPARDWRDFQEIKNQLVGEECEGVELYPAESRMVDLANQFHLWVIEDPELGFPFGMNGGKRMVSDVAGGGAVQRPRNNDEDEDEDLDPRDATGCKCETPARVTCGTCARSWCETCDPAAVSALCHYCNGRGYSTARLTDEEEE